MQSQLNHLVCLYVRACMGVYVFVILEKMEMSLCGDGVFGDCVQVLHS
jgi:hypothetical protein